MGARVKPSMRMGMRSTGPSEELCHSRHGDWGWKKNPRADIAEQPGNLGGGSGDDGALLVVIKDAELIKACGNIVRAGGLERLPERQDILGDGIHGWDGWSALFRYNT